MKTVQLANDWVVPHADVVRRDCDEDTTSLTDFMDRFGERATSVYSLDDQQIVRVVCTPDATVAVTTTLAVP